MVGWVLKKRNIRLKLAVEDKNMLLFPVRRITIRHLALQFIKLTGMLA